MEENKIYRKNLNNLFNSLKKEQESLFLFKINVAFNFKVKKNFYVYLQRKNKDPLKIEIDKKIYDLMSKIISKSRKREVIDGLEYSELKFNEVILFELKKEILYNII